MIDPQPGDRWENWKGTAIEIISIDFIANAVPKRKSILFGIRKRAIAAHDIPAASRIVIYRHGLKWWARSLENFQSKVGKRDRYTKL